MAKAVEQPTRHAQSCYPASYQALCENLELLDGIPYAKYWSAGADFLGLIVRHCQHARPSVILECSSGLTTLMLARCCQLNGHGHVYSLENGEDYVQVTRDALNRYGLGQTASVIHAPLEAVSLVDRSFQWYVNAGIPEAGIDMLVIDGPSGFIQRHSRYPAVPMLVGGFAEPCVVYLDDAARPDERESVARWLEEYPLARHQFVETERGCSILQFSRPFEESSKYKLPVLGRNIVRLQGTAKGT